MKYLSVCSGIEAATVAWEPLGWEAVAFSEIEKFPSAVLKHHYPTVQNLGDMTKFKEWPNANIDVLVGGTPCQYFSVAGLRKGLNDPRGNLMLTFLAIAQRYRPEWLVWENVPGVLSSGGGRDFGTFLGGLGLIGYGFAYRVLDAQYFGLAQRRKRVFVIGHLGDWRRAAAVLFERESLSGNPPPSRKAGQGAAHDVAPSIGASGRGFSRAGETRGQDPVIAHTLSAGGFDGSEDGSEDGSGRGTPIIVEQNNMASTPNLPSLRAHKTPNYGVAFESRFARNGRGAPSDVVPPLKAQSGETGKGDDAPLAQIGMTVRRLTPRECERLQGFPDDYTLIPYGNKLAADGPRYKALGNSMAVPVMRWIAERIKLLS